MKKLLLILLCVPLIGLGQDISFDKIIFSNQDTIYGTVIEVGVNEITYRHKEESTNNIIKSRKVAKIIYASGRTETFKGLRVLESKIEREEIQKLNKNQKKLMFKNSFELGVVFGSSINSDEHPLEELIPLERSGNNHKTFTEGITLKYNYTSILSFRSQLLYKINSNKYVNDITFTDANGTVIGVYSSYRISKQEYIYVPLLLEYNMNQAEITYSIKAGMYSAFLFKSTDETGYYEQILVYDVAVEDTELSTIDYFNRWDFGGIIGIGISYVFNKKYALTFECLANHGLIDTKGPLFDNISSGLTNKYYNSSITSLVGLSFKL